MSHVVWSKIKNGSAHIPGIGVYVQVFREVFSFKSAARRVKKNVSKECFTK
jgi:hypothetical protein